jgi:hypothetical protein
MADNPTYREWLNKYSMKDVNEILSKNEYHFPEESDPDNDPNASMENKRLFVYKLSWRAEKASWQF